MLTLKKRYPEMVTLWGIQMNICLYMFLAHFLVQKIFLKIARVLIFFSRETAARDELINEESLRAQRLLNTISLANYLV